MFILSARAVTILSQQERQRYVLLCCVTSAVSCLLCHLQELRGELMALYAAADRGWVELLKHCYTQHPPLNPANR